MIELQAKAFQYEQCEKGSIHTNSQKGGTIAILFLLPQNQELELYFIIFTKVLKRQKGIEKYAIVSNGDHKYGLACVRSIVIYC